MTNLRRSETSLAEAVELNSAEWLRLLGRLPWVEFHDDGDAVWVFAGDTWPRNNVALARFTPATAQRRVGEILHRHLEHEVACHWMVGPASQPKELGRHLLAHGFGCPVHCAGMACTLERRPAAPRRPREVSIKLVDEPPSLLPLTTERRRRRYAGHCLLLRLQPRQVWRFTAFRHGRPVGETGLCGGAGVAGIYDVEVLEQFRGRGIGSALVYAALRHARELGYPAAVLGATGIGLGVYERLGFREVCQLSFYQYGPRRQL